MWFILWVGCGDPAPSGVSTPGDLELEVESGITSTPLGQACETPPASPCGLDHLCLTTGAGAPLGRAWLNPRAVAPGGEAWVCAKLDVPADAVEVTLTSDAEGVVLPPLPYAMDEDIADSSLWALKLVADKKAADAQWTLSFIVWLTPESDDAAEEDPL